MTLIITIVVVQLMFVDSCEVEDRRNPTKRKYFREGRCKRSQSDYWLIFKTTDSQITYIDYVAAPSSDHSAVNIT